MKRIAVVGICGAGKSTLACELSKRLGLPLIHLDRHYWNPGWVETPTERWRVIQSQLVEGESWIIDGNFSSSFDIRFPKADTIIVLDFHRTLALYRAIKRTITGRSFSRPDIAEGCQERFDWEFLRFIWNFNRDHRPILNTSIESYGEGKKIIRLRSPRELRVFLKELL